MLKWLWILMCCSSGYAQALSLQMSAGLPQGAALTRLSKAPLIAAAALPNNAAETTQLNLAELLGEDETAELHGSKASLVINFPLPAQREVREVHLLLQGSSSNALIAPSQLLVTINKHVAGQIKLVGAQTQWQADIVLPVSALHHGYNVIRLDVAQHYAAGCESPLATQLWTQIDLKKSILNISSSERALHPQLDTLSQVFDKTTWERRPTVHLLTMQEPQDAQLQAMALVAQGTALRYEYVPIKVFASRYQTLWPATGNVILLGTRAELAPWLEGLNVPKGNQPILAVRPLPSDEKRALVLFAADDADGLIHLAQAYAMTDLPLPNLSWVGLDKLIMPAVGQLPSPPAMQANAQAVVPLQYLGYKTHTFTGFDTAGKTLSFWNDRWQGRVQMRLHLAYAAGMSTQSSMNVLVNGAMVGSIPLNDDSVGQYDDYAVSVPATAMKMGWNKLELQPVLIPQALGGECAPFFLGNLAVTVYDDSILERLGGSSLHQPDLGLLAYTGQTELQLATDKRLALQLLDKDPDTLSSALTLLSKLAQVQKRPLWLAWVGSGEVPANTGSRMVFGKLSELPENIRGELGAQYEVDMPLAAAATDNSWYAWLPPSLRDFFALQPALPQRAQADVGLMADLSQQVFAWAGERDGMSWTVFGAQTPAMLARGMDTLTDYSHWGQLKGRLAFWHPDDITVHSIPAEVTPISAFGLRGGLGIFASQHPWLALLAVLLLVAIFVLLAPRLLRLYRVRHHPAE